MEAFLTAEAFLIAVSAVAVAAVVAVSRLLRRPSVDEFRRVRSERDEALAARDEALAAQGRAEDASRGFESELRSAVAQRDKAVHDLDASRELHGAALAAQSQRLEEARSACDEVRGQRDRIRGERDGARHDLAALRADHDARVQELAKAREQLDVGFKAIAAEVVRASNETFLKQAGEQFDSQRKLNESGLEKREQAIDSLVKPVAENLAEFQRRIGELEEKREGAYKGLEKELTLLRDEAAGLRAATGSLSEAMRSPQVRGMWGEHQLRRVLELSGMRAHVDFHEQQSSETADGQVRPDAVVRVPGGISVVIDAKTPLNSYLDACGADDDKQQAALLGKHASALMGHARSLSAKEYTAAFSGSPDFTLMFVPADPILDAAMDVQPALWDDAWLKHRVLIATPGLLLAFLRTVALAWQQQSMQENAKEIAEQGKELYKRLRIYTGHVADVGRCLGRTVNAYNKSVGSMRSRLLPQARKLEALGVSAHLPDKDRVETPPELQAIPRELPRAEAVAVGGRAGPAEPEAG